MAEAVNLLAPVSSKHRRGALRRADGCWLYGERMGALTITGPAPTTAYILPQESRLSARGTTAWKREWSPELPYDHYSKEDGLTLDHAQQT